MKITGTYEGKKESIDISLEDFGIVFTKEDAIREGKRAVSVIIFGTSKKPPFYKKAWDIIDNISWEIS